MSHDKSGREDHRSLKEGNEARSFSGGIKEPSESWESSNRVLKATQKVNRYRRSKNLSGLDIRGSIQRHAEMLLLGDTNRAKRSSLRPGKNVEKMLIALGVAIMGAEGFGEGSLVISART